MQYMGDAAWWDKRFEARGQQPLPPDAALIRHLERLKPGEALDIACGDGRNALYLAEQGFRVTGADFSVSALNRLHSFARKRGLAVETVPIDFSSEEAFCGLGIYDTIIVNHYRMSVSLLARLPQHVASGGTVWINGFCCLPRSNTAITEQELIRREDYAGLESAFRRILQEEYETELGNFLTLLYQKK